MHASLPSKRVGSSIADVVLSFDDDLALFADRRFGSLRSVIGKLSIKDSSPDGVPVRPALNAFERAEVRHRSM